MVQDTKTTKWLLALWALTLGCAGIVLYAGLFHTASESVTDKIIAALGSKNPEERRTSESRLMAWRAASIANALNLLKAEQTNATPDRARATECIRCLGRLKASEASATLVEFVELEDPTYDHSISLQPDRNPSFAALIEIGRPAVSSIVDGIAGSTNDNRTRHLVFMLREIEGHSKARLILAQAASQTTQKNIEKATAWLDKFTPESTSAQ